MPIKFLFSLLQATAVVPEPRKGSNTKSPGLVETNINFSIKERGFWEDIFAGGS